MTACKTASTAISRASMKSIFSMNPSGGGLVTVTSAAYHRQGFTFAARGH